MEEILDPEIFSKLVRRVLIDNGKTSSAKLLAFFSMEDTRTASILLLGDPGCGKSTFLSRLSQGQHALKGSAPLPKLHDFDQPFIFDISMYNRPYRFEFYDTSSPENYTLLQPDFVILCFDVTDRKSLVNVPQVWRKDVTRNYKKDGDDPPLMMLGLKRDARVEEEGVIYPQEVRFCLAGLHGASG
ncbi:MAG: hypothetical protein LQ339_001985 [Xanthoria mediterranea]|nr:MAG: hypothetical protein LQ339_001985 [Xanthoria mediterranea]